MWTIKLIPFPGMIMLIVFCHQCLAQSLMPTHPEISKLSSAYQMQVEGLDPLTLSGTGYYPLLRAKHAFEMRAYADGTMPDIWTAWERFKQNELRSGRSIPVPNWKSLGPNTIDSITGRTVSHCFHPNDPDILFVGASSGGLWKTENDGATWEVVNDDLPNLRVGAITIDPENTDRMLIGTGNFQGFSITLGPGVGILESDNGGATWSPNSFNYSLTASVSVVRLEWDKTDFNRVFMAATNGFWISYDKGANWTLKFNGQIDDLEIVDKTPGVQYISARGDGIYKSTDFGENWTKLGGGYTDGASMHRASLAVCDSFPDVVYASITRASDLGLDGLYKSSNAGGNWSLVTTPNYLCQPALPSSCQGWFNNCVEVSPVDSNLIFVGGVTFHRSDDGGSSWTWHDYISNGSGGSNPGLVYVDCHDIGFKPGSPSTVFVFNDGGVQRSDNNGLWWKKTAADMVTAQIYKMASSPHDTVSFIGGFQDHGLQWLDNTGGNTFWERLTTNDGCAVNWDPENPDVFYGDVLFNFHYKFVRLPGGTITAIPINNGITTSSSVAFGFATTHDPVRSNILFSATDSKIYRTTNGGGLWEEVADVAFIRTMGISKIDPDVVYAAHYDNSFWSFWHSLDGGDNWVQTPQSPGWRVTDIEPDPIDLGVVYATRNSAFAGNPHLYRSTDHGNTWAPVGETVLPDVPVWTVVVHPHDNDVIFIATDIGVLVSTDKGETWSDYNENIPRYYVYDMAFHEMDTTLRMATIGRGAWKTKARLQDISAGIPLTESLLNFTIQPNPATDQVIVQLDADAGSSLEVEIWGADGQQVRTLFNGKAGNETSVQWNLTDSRGQRVPPGLYFIRAYYNNRSVSKQVVVH